MKHAYFNIALLVISSLVLTACAPDMTGRVVQEETIVIGYTSPLTGDAAAWGEPMLQGAKLAVKEINDKGGINGKLLKLSVQDDKCEASTGLTAYRAFRQQGISIVAGAPCSSAALAVATNAQKDRVLFLSSAASNPALTHAGEFIFRLYPSDLYEGKETAKYMFDGGARSIAILAINNDYGLGLAQALEETFETKGGKVVASETFGNNQHDVHTEVLKLITSNPDAIYVASNPGQTPTILSTLEQLANDIPVYVNAPALQTGDVLELSGISAAGVRTVSAKIPAREQFRVLYEELYGKQADFLGALGYDSIVVMIPAFEICGSDSICLKDELAKVKNMSGATGKISFDGNGDRVGITYDLLVVSEGVLVAK